MEPFRVPVPERRTTYASPGEVLFADQVTHRCMHGHFGGNSGLSGERAGLCTAIRAGKQRVACNRLALLAGAKLRRGLPRNRLAEILAERRPAGSLEISVIGRLLVLCGQLRPALYADLPE